MPGRILFNVHMPYRDPLIPCVRCSDSVPLLRNRRCHSHLRFIESDCVGPDSGDRNLSHLYRISRQFAVL
jgi:hypothetical protein